MTPFDFAITVIFITIIGNMSSHVPGNVSTYNEEMAPLIDKLKQSYVPIDVKAAFDQLLEYLHNDELDACIEAGEELLKKRIPDTTRTRVHILIGSCLADPDEMEEHYEKALHLWTLLNAEHADTRIDPWLREARAQLDALSDAIKEERSEETTTELTMSTIIAVETAPVLSSSDSTPEATSQPGPDNSSRLPHPSLEPSPDLTSELPVGHQDNEDLHPLSMRGLSSVNDGHIQDTPSAPIEDSNSKF